MSWFRVSSVIFAFWAVVFFFFPRFTNERAGVGYVTSEHAQDWTQIVGLFSLAFAVILNEAHSSSNVDVRRIVARGVLAFTLPCAFLMTCWQIIPDRRWFRLDLANVALLCMISYGMFLHGEFSRQGDLRQNPRPRSPGPSQGA
ncbi:MAG: hypothetical protein OES47_03190 [Acidobacteriota bacterium]|nr:hypothetical protein [Acidobacteriota bacterium]